jgi:CDP-diacylglycerol--serine O-phosphatidyltransferase
MRPNLKRGIVVLPSALTLANLFFGVWAMVSAAQGRFETAAWLIVGAAFLDMIDGRVARYTATGSKFGEQLDSLVDAISFGVAPALIIYFQFLREGPWGWIASFIYITAVVMRLARFNVEQAGGAKAVFYGLPSPTAGSLLATFYPFSQTAFFANNLAGLPWADIMTGTMVVLGGLMVSHIPYAVVPKFGFRTAKGVATLGLMVLTLAATFLFPRYYFFGMAVLYTAYGLAKSLVLGLFERLPDRDPLLDEEGDPDMDEAGAEQRDLTYEGPTRGGPRLLRRRQPSIGVDVEEP